MVMGYKGHVRKPNKDHLQQLSARRHRALHASLVEMAPPPTWDCRTLGWVPPVKNQGSCGSCWDFSGTAVVEGAYIKAGVFPNDGSMALSEEYTLSCGDNGGCNGDDNTSVLIWAKKTGLPLTKDYGQYTASAEQCAFKQSMTLYKIDDWGFASGSEGQTVTATELIKAAIMKYGIVGCAVAAGGSEFWNTGKGIGDGNSDSIDHDVALVGWNDTSTKVSALVGDASLASLRASITASDGWWWMRNSWGESWGDNGYAKIKYGADQIGTETVWAVVNGHAPPIDYYV